MVQEKRAMILLDLVGGGGGKSDVHKGARQAQLLDEAHEQVSWAQQSEQALARQMYFTDLALLSQDEVAIAKRADCPTCGARWSTRSSSSTTNRSCP